MDREVSFEDEVAAVLDLTDGIESAQVHGRALMSGELRAEDQRPVIETFPNPIGGEAVRRRLERFRVGNGEEGVVIFAELHPLSVEFVFHEAVTVQIVCGLERKERRHPQHHRPQRLVAKVEVVMSEPAALPGENAVVGISRRKLRNRGAKRVSG
jgi:hypothetical protein